MSATPDDASAARRILDLNGRSYDYFSLDAAAAASGIGDISRLPFTLKILWANIRTRNEMLPGVEGRSTTPR